MRIRLIERRMTGTFASKFFIFLLGVVVSLIAGGLLIHVGGANVFEGYTALFKGAFGSIESLSETLVKTVPLLIIALGLIMAFRAGAWNIGAEGQLYAGALTATVVGLYFQGPFPLPLILALIAGFLGGCIWGFIPGVLKAKFGMNEILTTLMLNYVMIYFLSYLLYGPLRDPASVVPQTAYISEGAWLPRLIGGTRLHVGILIGASLVVLTYVLLYKTVLGYKLRTTRYTKSARYAGISVTSYIIIAMLLSGGLAGLAGATEVSGLHHRLRGDMSPGYGFTAIVIVVLGNLHPLWTTIAAFFYASIMVGSSTMQITTGVHTSIAFIFIGLIPVVFLIVRFLGQYKIVLTKGKIIGERG